MGTIPWTVYHEGTTTTSQRQINLSRTTTKTVPIIGMPWSERYNESGFGQYNLKWCLVAPTSPQWSNNYQQSLPSISGPIDYYNRIPFRGQYSDQTVMALAMQATNAMRWQAPESNPTRHRHQQGIPSARYCNSTVHMVVGHPGLGVWSQWSLCNSNNFGDDMIECKKNWHCDGKLLPLQLHVQSLIQEFWMIAHQERHCVGQLLPLQLH
jgi:hypothetical protein